MEPPIFSSCLLPLLYNSRVFSTLELIHVVGYCLYCGSKVYGLPGDLLTEGIVCVCDNSLPHELIHDDIPVPDLDLDTLGGFVSVENNREVELRVERVLHWLRFELGSLTFDEDVGVGPAYQVLLQETLG